MIILFKNERLALKFELMIILSKIREKLEPKFDKLEIADFFSNFHVVQSIAL